MGQANRQSIAARTAVVLKRVAVSTFNDGFIHAGNLAYLAMLAIFPFFITAAALFSIIGEESERAAIIQAVLTTLPPTVRETIGPVAREVVEARTGWLLWIGGAIGLWTVGSLIETIRDILRRAYGTAAVRAFWQYRLLSTGVIIAAVVAMMLALLAQVLIGTAQQFIAAYVPNLDAVTSSLALSRIIPALALFGSMYLLFFTLTPTEYRTRQFPKWPGALLVAVWWMTVTTLMPWALSTFFTYNLTYGALAGMMVALLFFWLVGLGVVVGAELNAALAEAYPDDDLPDAADQDVATPSTGLGDDGQSG